MSLLDDLRPLVQPRSVLCVGEFHGTEEFPRVIAGLVTTAVAAGLAVTLGLEIPMSEQDNIASVLADPDTPVAGPWWNRSDEFLDGRSSVAMAELITNAGQQRRDGADIEIVAMDGPWVAPGSPIPLELIHLLEQDRDQGMATRLLDAIDRRPRAFTLVLAGSEHTSVLQGEVNPGRSMASYIRAWHRNMVSLGGLSSGGTAWVLGRRPEGPGIVEVDGVELDPGAQWASTVGDDGHHGYLHVGQVTASPPYLDTHT